MKKKVLIMRFFSIILMAMMVLTTLSTIVLADNKNDALAIDQFDNQTADTQTAGSFRRFIANAIRLVQVVGVGVATIMLIVLAIKYVSAAPSEKAEIKKTAVIYITGAVVLFAAAAVLQIIKNFAETNVQAQS